MMASHTEGYNEEHGYDKRPVFGGGKSDEFIRIGKAFGESLKYGRVTNLFSTIK